MQAISTAAQSLHELLGDILDLSKIEEGKVTLDRVDFDPAQLPAGTAAIYRELGQATGTAVHTALELAALPRASGDPMRLRQVVTNLLGNVLKFAARGQGTGTAACPCSCRCGLRPARVLVVEDNAVNQLVVQAMLERLGMTVHLAADGAEAVATVEAHAIELVLMDCQMHVMGGYEAARRIRAARHLRRQVPIVALTAHALAEDRQRCAEAGMDDYLSKPVTGEMLAAALRRPWARPLPAELGGVPAPGLAPRRQQPGDGSGGWSRAARARHRPTGVP